MIIAVTVVFDRWTRICMVSWLEEDTLHSVHSIDRVLINHNITVRRLVIGYDVPDETGALHAAAVFSYGVYSRIFLCVHHLIGM